MKKHRIDHAPIVKRFAAELRRRREKSGLTQLELAGRASVSTNYISRLEAARVSPGIDTLVQLADALGITAHDLLPLNSTVDGGEAISNRVRVLVEKLLQRPERELIEALVPILAKLAEGPRR